MATFKGRYLGKGWGRFANLRFRKALKSVGVGRRAIPRYQKRGIRFGGPGFARTGGYYGRFKGRRASGLAPELKFHDLAIDDAVIATGGTIVEDSCNGIAQGVTESQRIGRKCVIKAIHWKMNIALPNTSVPNETSDTARIILYLDKQCNGATATVAGILEDADYQSFKNLANKGRFRTLMDRTYDLNSQSGAYDGTNDQFGEHTVTDEFHKQCNIPIEFDSTTGAITEVRSNNIGVLSISGTGKASIFSQMRLRFADV